MANRRARATSFWLSLLVVFLVACGGGVATPTATNPATAAQATVPATATTAARAASPAASLAASPTAAALASPARVATPASPVASPGAAGTPAATTYPLTLKDDAGRAVTLKASPQRIASLAASNTEILYALGLGDRVAGVEEHSDYPPAAQAKPKIGGFFQNNIEPVVALQPDLVLAAGIQSKEYLAALEGQGLTVFVLNAQSLPGVLDDITAVGRLADVNGAAATLRAGLQARLDAVAATLTGATSDPRVYVEIDPTFYTAGPGSFINDLVTRAGGANIAADAKSPFPQLSAEAIVARDPQVIVLADEPAVTADAVKARSGWAGISAVKDNRIVVIDTNLVSRPGPRVFDALELLARAFHPELFR
ncbi:MAG TPA: cobalamin-binding protein [Thermomicrobiales bacterium]|nr:cobalamin-binding protein [Thermomicrobiales bacterium]